MIEFMDEMMLTLSVIQKLSSMVHAQMFRSMNCLMNCTMNCTMETMYA